MANGLWYTVLYLIIATAATVFAAQRFLHMMQLESYQGKMYLKWLKKHVGSEWVPFLMAGIIAILLRAGYVLFYYAEGLYLLSDILWYAGDAVYVILMLLFGWANAKKPQKKPLKYTGRVIRLIVALTVVVAVFWLDLFIGLFCYDDCTISPDIFIMFWRQRLYKRNNCSQIFSTEDGYVDLLDKLRFG